MALEMVDRSIKRAQIYWSHPKGRLGRVKLGSCCSVTQEERKVVSVSGVHQGVIKQTHVINKSEVYSHYLGLFWGGVGQRHNKRHAKQGCCKKTKTTVSIEIKPNGSQRGHLATKYWGHSESSVFRSVELPSQLWQTDCRSAFSLQPHIPTTGAGKILKE